jgi:hypothetical protein
MSITRHAEQRPADVAVVTPTILRPSLLRAARSVFGQTEVGRIHLLIGIDVPQGDTAVLDTIRAECPAHVMLTVLDLGYSTSRRHGGVYSNVYSGSLRAILTLAANSARVAYLDDNDWYAPNHLSLLLKAIEGRPWAFSYRWLVDPGSGWPICQDDWDSLGPGRGINQKVFGGFVQPSTLMIDKLACQSVVPLWANAAFADGSGEDRLVFEALRGAPFGCSQEATTFCTLSPDSLAHNHHAEAFEQRGLRWVAKRNLVNRAEARLREAHARLGGGLAAEALSACEAGLAIHRHQPDALHLMARCLIALGRTQEAAPFQAEAELLAFGSDPVDNRCSAQSSMLGSNQAASAH